MGDVEDVVGSKRDGVANKFLSIEEVVGTSDVFGKDYFSVSLSDVYGAGASFIRMNRISPSVDISVQSSIPLSKSGRAIASAVAGISETVDRGGITRIISISETIVPEPKDSSVDGLSGGSGNAYWTEISLNGSGVQVDSVSYNSDNNEVSFDGTIPSGQSVDVTVYEDVGDDGNGGSTDPNGKSYDNSGTVTFPLRVNQVDHVIRKSRDEVIGEVIEETNTVTKQVVETVSSVWDRVTNVL